MTTEEINKLNENPGLDQVKKFIDTIEKDGYIITNFKTFRMQTEKITSNNLEPIRIYESLQKTKTGIGNMEKVQNQFKNDIGAFLEKILNIVSKDPNTNFIDDYKKLDDKQNIDIRNNKTPKFAELQSKLRDISVKFGLLSFKGQIAKTESNKAEIKAQIDALDDDTTLTPQQKMQKAKDLLIEYNKADKEISKVKDAANAQETKFNLLFDEYYIDKINQDLKEIYNYLVTSDLTYATKTILNDEFENMLSTRDKFRSILYTYITNLKNIKKSLNSLGISHKDDLDITIPKEFKPNIESKINIEMPRTDVKIDLPPIPESVRIPEYIAKINEIVVYKGGPGVNRFSNITRPELETNKEYKITDVVIKDGITYYKFDGKGDSLYEASLFNAKKEDLNPVKEDKKESKDSQKATQTDDKETSNNDGPSNDSTPQKNDDLNSSDKDPVPSSSESNIPPKKRGKKVKEHKLTHFVENDRNNKYNPAYISPRLGFRTIGNIGIMTALASIPGIGSVLSAAYFVRTIYSEYKKYQNSKKLLDEPTVFQLLNYKIKLAMRDSLNKFYTAAMEKSEDLSPEEKMELQEDMEQIAPETQNIEKDKELDELLANDKSVSIAQRMMFDKYVKNPTDDLESPVRTRGR